MKNKINRFRFCARLIIEAETPLAVGSGKQSLLSDRLVLVDVNGLPYIPGTSLAGVLRHSMNISEDKKRRIFGFQDVAPGEGEGSRLIFTSAHLLNEDGRVLDGLLTIDSDSTFFQKYTNLPIRQHVKINHRGVAADQGKFDEQIVYKGTRFCFEMEMLADQEDVDLWNLVINEFQDSSFRLGSGTRKGFGAVKVVSCEKIEIDLEKNLKVYLDKTSSLNNIQWWSNAEVCAFENKDSNLNWVKYCLEIEPKDFFVFSSGLESQDADITFVREDVLCWDSNNKAYWNEGVVFMPASSIKGAIAHRVAFYFNRSNGVTVESIKSLEGIKQLVQKGYLKSNNIQSFDSAKFEDILDMVIKGNPAVIALFGTAEGAEGYKKGNVIISDCYFVEKLSSKVLNHVSIDRFSGGAIDGALFGEEVVYGKGRVAKIHIWVNKSLQNEAEIIDAFERSLMDICNGFLPLGGGTMRGNGCFTGKLTKDGEEIKYE